MGAVGWSAAGGAAVEETDAKAAPQLMQRAAASDDSVAQIGHFFMGPSGNRVSLAGNLPSTEGEVNPHWQRKWTGEAANRLPAGSSYGEYSVVNSPGFDTE